MCQTNGNFQSGVIQHGLFPEKISLEIQNQGTRRTEEAWELEQKWAEEESIILSEAAKVLKHCRRAWWWERRRWKKAGVENYGKTIWVPKRYVHTLIIPYLCGADSEVFVVPEHIILYDQNHWHHCCVYVLTKDGKIIKRGWGNKYAVTQKEVNSLCK